MTGPGEVYAFVQVDCIRKIMSDKMFVSNILFWVQLKEALKLRLLEALDSVCVSQFNAEYDELCHHHRQ